MFDPIKGPNNEYGAPAVGHGTENGDSWHTAVKKINDGFKRIIHAIETGPSIEGVEMVDAESRKEIAELRETIAALQMRLDAMTAPAYPNVNADDGNATDPAAMPAAGNTPPPSQEPIADFNPGSGVTTSRTYIGAGNPAA